VPSLLLFIDRLLLALLLLVSLPFPFELPNILLISPPCPEILLRDLPAGLLEVAATGALIYCGRR
jgi:hypothetical protein